MFMKRIPKVFYVVILIWIMVVYNILNRWELINSKNYFALEFFIYLFILVAFIWGTIWCIRNNSFRTKKTILLFTLILVATVATCTHFADTAKLYMDFTINYHARRDVSEKLVREYRQSLKTEEYPESLIFLGEKYRKLSTDGYAWIHRDRGCIEVDFEVFDGKGHNLIDFFNYGKSGHITYVTEVDKYLKEGTIQNDILATKKIFRNWYYNLTKY